MRRNSAQYRIEGTSALKPVYADPARKTAHVLPFPGKTGNITEKSTLITKLGSIASRVKECIQSVLEASEMYCSLRFENFKGVPYGAFTRKGIAVLSASAAALACVSIIVGA